MRWNTVNSIWEDIWFGVLGILFLIGLVVVYTTIFSIGGVVLIIIVPLVLLYSLFARKSNKIKIQINAKD